MSGVAAMRQLLGRMSEKKREYFYGRCIKWKPTAVNLLETSVEKVWTQDEFPLKGGLID